MVTRLADNEYVVGVFEHERRSGRIFLMAYLRDYNPQWPGCCVHRVIAEGGQMAKDSAKAQHRRECMAGRPVLVGADIRRPGPLETP